MEWFSSFIIFNRLKTNLEKIKKYFITSTKGTKYMKIYEHYRITQTLGRPYSRVGTRYNQAQERGPI